MKTQSFPHSVGPGPGPTRRREAEVAGPYAWDWGISRNKKPSNTIKNQLKPTKNHQKNIKNQFGRKALKTVRSGFENRMFVAWAQIEFLAVGNLQKGVFSRFVWKSNRCKAWLMLFLGFAGLNVLCYRKRSASSPPKSLKTPETTRSQQIHQVIQIPKQNKKPKEIYSERPPKTPKQSPPTTKGFNNQGRKILKNQKVSKTKKFPKPKNLQIQKKQTPKTQKPKRLKKQKVSKTKNHKKKTSNTHFFKSKILESPKI